MTVPKNATTKCEFEPIAERINVFIVFLFLISECKVTYIFGYTFELAIDFINSTIIDTFLSYRFWRLL